MHSGRGRASPGDSVTIPILLYHHLDPELEESDTTLHPERFEAQMRLLKEKGFNTVDFDDLTAFVGHGKPLPENPVIVTFDDGYMSNYTYAFPVLRELEMNAVIFPVGSSVGHDRFYKDTQFELTPHFGQDEIREMLDSGVICFGSHTYDMHQWPPFEEVSPARQNILMLPGESEAEYRQALTADCACQKELFRSLGLSVPTVIAYPMGQYTELSDEIVRACGYTVTLTTDPSRINTVVCGDPESLIDMGRLTVLPEYTDEDLLAYLLP